MKNYILWISAFHEEAPATKITTDTAFVFCVWRHVLIIFEVLHVEEGVIRIQKRCVEY